MLCLFIGRSYARRTLRISASRSQLDRWRIPKVKRLVTTAGRRLVTTLGRRRMQLLLAAQVQVVEVAAADVQTAVTIEVGAKGLAPSEVAKLCARVHRKR